jgi:hypothetical protein
MERKDVVSFDKATEKRVTPRDRQAIRAQLIVRNYWRMRRMQGDIEWLKRTLRRMGLNPEDWSSYL